MEGEFKKTFQTFQFACWLEPRWNHQLIKALWNIKVEFTHHVFLHQLLWVFIQGDTKTSEDTFWPHVNAVRLRKQMRENMKTNQSFSIRNTISTSPRWDNFELLKGLWNNLPFSCLTSTVSNWTKLMSLMSISPPLQSVVVYSHWYEL